MSRPNNKLEIPAPQHLRRSREVELRSPPYRSGTKAKLTPTNFLFVDGGLGDHICWIPAILWIAEHFPHVEGTLWAPDFFIELARFWLKDCPRWSVRRLERFLEDYEDGTVIISARHGDITPYINATGAHLVALGFQYFANQSPVPAGTTYPRIELLRSDLPREVRRLEGKYAVFTPGFTAPSRATLARHWNPILEYVVSLGLTPVFLGRSTLTGHHKAVFDDEMNFALGIDLRDKTTLLEAAAICQHAAFTIGLDNGILHLAACTEAPVVFGYNIASPEHREPLRWGRGRTENVYLSHAELACNFCQSTMKLNFEHDFRVCLYGDHLCIEKLFANQGQRWKDAIDQILKEK